MDPREATFGAYGAWTVVYELPYTPLLPLSPARYELPEATIRLVPPLVLQEEREWPEGSGLVYSEQHLGWLYNEHLVLTNEEIWKEPEMKRSELLKKAFEEAVVNEELEKFFNDLPNDAVISWNQNWYGKESLPQYSYVAIKCAGFWYATGLNQGVRWSTAKLLEFMKYRTSDVWIVSEWETFLEED